MTTWPASWKGRCIWWPSQGEFGYLRRSFHLDSVPGEVKARVCANSRYVLFVNGELLGRGPIRSEPLHLFYDTYDIAPILREGPNVIAAWCRLYVRPNVFWKPGAAAGWFLFEASGGELDIASGDDWKAMPAPYGEYTPGFWQQGQPNKEILDGAEVPVGWSVAGFDDSHWAKAEVRQWGLLDRPFLLMSPRPIPQLEEKIILPPSGGEFMLEPNELQTIDFGRITRAHPRLKVIADSGVVLDLTCGEDLQSDGAPEIRPREWTFQYTSRGGEQDVESFEAVGFRYLSVRPSGRARVSVEARESHYPRQEGALFRCDDEVLNQIWETGVRTLDLCSTDAFIDCPGREQRAWLGDAFLTSLISLVANPDTRLVKHTLRLHGEGQRADGLLPAAAACDFSLLPSALPDHSLLWIRGLRCAWDYTGDEELIDELLPRAIPILQFFEEFRGDNGLLEDVPGWVFIDWAQTERGSNIAALDAFYVLALEDFASIASARGQSSWATWAKGLARRSKKAFGRYWDRKRDVYLDTAGGRRVSQQTNSLAIVAGCAPASRHDRILSYILDEERLKITKTPGDSFDWSERLAFQWMEPENFNDEHDVVSAQPFFSHFLHGALVKAGRREQLVPMLKRWELQLESGNGCFEEYWGAPPGGGSRCHVWSATPVYDAISYLLGVRPAKPGFAEVEIDPHFGPLNHLSGRVPTPHGFIEVEAHRDGDTKVKVPEGVNVLTDSRS